MIDCGRLVLDSWYLPLMQKLIKAPELSKYAFTKASVRCTMYILVEISRVHQDDGCDRLVYVLWYFEGL